MSEKTRRTDFEEAYKQAYSAWATFQEASRNDLRAVTHHAWTSQDIKHMRKLQPEREIMSFPLLRRFTRLIGNFQRNNRLSITYAPVEGSDEVTANQLAMCAQHALANGNGYWVISDAFEGALKTGINLVNQCNDRNGNTVFDRHAYNSFLLHPGFTKRDLSDCQYGILRKHITRMEAKMLLPGHERLIDNLQESEKDDKFPFMPARHLYGEKLLNYDEFQQRTTVKKRYVSFQDRPARDSAGNRIEWTGTKSNLERLMFMFPGLTFTEEWVRSVKVTCYLNGTEMWNAEDPWSIGDFSFTPVICFFDPEETDYSLRIQSVVRGMKDAQRVHDRRTIANLMVLETTIGAGLDVEANALVDNAQAYTAGPGKPRFFQEGAIAEGRFRDRPAPSLPAGYMELQQTFDQMMGKIINLNEDGLMGVDQKDQLLLGVVGKMRMGLGMIGMFDFFDNLSLAQKVMGGKTLRLVQQYSPERVFRICNEPPSPAFGNREFGQYDCVPAETVLTDTQRNQLYTELLQLKRAGAEMGDPFPAPWGLIMKYAPIAMKNDYMKAVAQMEKQQQAEMAKQKELQAKAQELALMETAANIAADQGRALERQTQAAENQATMAQARVKTAAEIQNERIKPYTEAMKLALEQEKITAMKEKSNAPKK